MVVGEDIDYGTQKGATLEGPGLELLRNASALFDVLLVAVLRVHDWYMALQSAPTTAEDCHVRLVHTLGIPSIGHEGFSYQESQLWFWEDAIHIST